MDLVAANRIKTKWIGNMMQIDDLIFQVPCFEEVARTFKDPLLANLILIGEIPAPTFQEEDRVHLLTQRFNESRLLNCSTDEIGNGMGIYPGEDGDRYILLTAHADSLIPAEDDHTVTIMENSVAGRGLADNSLGLAILATLPMLLDALEIKLQSSLLLMADVRSLGRGNLEGISFYLNNNRLPIQAGICLEGVALGRLNYLAVDMLRGEIVCEIPEQHQWNKFGLANAVVLLNEVISQILEIPIASKPQTSIVIGEVSGGKTFDQIPTEAVLRFEVRSEEPERAGKIGQIIEDICMEISSRSGARVELDVVATRKCGGLNFRHPLPRMIRRLHKSMGIPTIAAPSESELAAFIHHGVPAATIGLTEGKNINTRKETLSIDPIYKGLAQLVAILIALDGGGCE